MDEMKISDIIKRDPKDKTWLHYMLFHFFQEEGFKEWNKNKDVDVSEWSEQKTLGDLVLERRWRV